MNRWIATFLITITVLFALAMLGYSCGKWESVEQIGFNLASSTSRAEPPPLCVPDEATRELLRGLMLEALDNALKTQIEHLFATWMKDDRGQPDRARLGVEQAVRAHQRARKGAIEWAPPVCAG